MPRVLVVTSMFLPYLAADVHRARLLASALPPLGWEVEILAPGEEYQSREHFEPHAKSLRTTVPVHRVPAEWAWLFRFLGVRSLGWRAYRAMSRAGSKVLAGKTFDLVFISCSQASFFHLGVRWSVRRRVPFVIDLHDPWFQPNRPRARHIPNWKLRVSNRIAAGMERATLGAAAGIVAVSPGYLMALKQRYGDMGWPALAGDRSAVIPFAASEEDIAIALGLGPPPEFVARPETKRIVYTGAGGVIMEDSFREVCRQLAEVKRCEPNLLAGVQLALYGTEPRAAAGEARLRRIAIEHGLSDLVSEAPARLSYLEALRRVVHADGLLVLGVADPDYSPSKLFLYAASGKPLLACMARGSAIEGFFAQHRALGHLIPFEAGGKVESADTSREMRDYLREIQTSCGIDRRPFMKEFLTPAMARRHVELFARCVEGRVAP